MFGRLVRADSELFSQVSVLHLCVCVHVHVQVQVQVQVHVHVHVLVCFVVLLLFRCVYCIATHLLFRLFAWLHAYRTFFCFFSYLVNT